MPVRALLLVVIALGLVASCGSNQRKDTLRVTLVAFNTARVGFLEWDDKHQDAIVAKAETAKADADAGKLTRDEAKKALEASKKEMEAYRKGRDDVVKMIISTLTAIAHAATQDDGPSFDAALAEAKAFYQALKKLKGE